LVAFKRDAALYSLDMFGYLVVALASFIEYKSIPPAIHPTLSFNETRINMNIVNSYGYIGMIISTHCTHIYWYTWLRR